MGKLEAIGKNAKQGSRSLRPCVACRTVYGLLLAALAMLLASCDNFGGPIEWATYTIIYHANDGSGRTERFTVNYGTTHAIRKYILEHDAYFLRGWESPCKARTFDAGYPARRLATSAGQTINLYAIWNGYIVVFHPNGGSGNAPWPMIGNGGVRLPDHNGLEKYGHVFVGWGMTRDESEGVFPPGHEFDLTRSITLYAVWVSEALVYIVDFDSNGGHGEGPPRSVVNIGYHTWLPWQYGFYRDGHAFMGWGRTPNAANYYGAGAMFTPTGHVTLYALWREGVDFFIVTFDGDNGLATVPSRRVAISGIGIMLPAGVPLPGHVFVGWAFASGSTVADHVAGFMFVPTGNVTLYAVWRPAEAIDDYFTVTFDNDNGPGTVPSPIEVASGIGIMLPAGVPLPRHVFVGWALASGSTVADHVAGFVFVPTGHVTLYAVWGPATSTGDFTISFADFFDIDTESIGPTLRIIGTPEQTTGRITVTYPRQYDPDSIRWFLGGVEITNTTNPGVISGVMGETLTLDSRLHNNNIRTHRVTVSVRKAGVPFSKVIVFTVVP